MNLSWLAFSILLLGLPFQVTNQKVCDRAQPPPGMRWQCAEANPCDCHLVPRAGGGLEGDERKVELGSATCVPCRITYFVLPEYPEAARKAQKQGSVSVMLVLRPGGDVEDVRVQSGDPVLASAVQVALKQWRFTAGNREESIPASVRFELSDRPAGAASGTSLLNPVILGKPLR